MTKKLIALATLAALATAAGPAMAATTKTATITVKWNTQAIASLNLHTDYSATGVYGASAGTILTQANLGSGTCTGTDPSNTDGIVDFGTPSPDSAVFTDCLYKNGVNAIISTNSVNWNLAVAATAGYVAANGTLCAYANNGGVGFPFANNAAYAVTQTTRVAAVTNTSAGACAAGGGPGQLMDATGGTLVTCTHAFTAASPANIGMDIELALANNAPTGSTTVTETYTLTAN